MDKNSLTKIADLVRIYPYKKGIGQGYLMSDDIKTLLGCFAPKTLTTFFKKKVSKKIHLRIKIYG